MVGCSVDYIGWKFDSIRLIKSLYVLMFVQSDCLFEFDILYGLMRLVAGVVEHLHHCLMKALLASSIQTSPLYSQVDCSQIPRLYRGEPARHQI